jgi:hypothetical protein
MTQNAEEIAIERQEKWISSEMKRLHKEIKHDKLIKKYVSFSFIGLVVVKSICLMMKVAGLLRESNVIIRGNNYINVITQGVSTC